MTVNLTSGRTERSRKGGYQEEIQENANCAKFAVYIWGLRIAFIIEGQIDAVFSSVT